MPSKFQEMLKQQRLNEETSRAGLTWEAEEESRLMEMVSQKVSTAEIANEFKRTEGSIKTRLFTIVCNSIDTELSKEEEVYDKYGITKEELDEFRIKKQKREENLQTRQQNKKNRKVTYDRTVPYTIDDVMTILISLKNDVEFLKNRT